MDISVIIVNYNVKEFLRGTLVSVERALAHGKLEGEIFVVDNNSADDSVEMVREEFPHVHLLAQNVNLGFGKANNLAAHQATGDYILLLNPDTIVGEDTLQTMVAFMKANPDTGLSGCKLLNADGSFQDPCRRGFPTPWASFTKLFGLSKLFPKSKLFSQYYLSYLPIDETYEVDAVSGAFMFLSRAAWEATGGFDEAYFMYGEDLDLCYRVKKAGFKVFYVPTTATIHFRGESTKRSAINEVQVFYDAMHIFVKKNYGASRLFALTLRLGIFLRTLVAVLKKHKGAALMASLDALAVAVSVLLVCWLLLDNPFGLPSVDYPFAILAPMLIVVLVLASLGAYGIDSRRKTKPVLLAAPTTLIILSSLTYFFKDFASSRSLLLAHAGLMTGLLSFVRLGMKMIDRVRFGGDKSARPALRNTVIVGTNEEALRIAALLKRTQFIRRYNVVGFIANDLTRLQEQLLPEAPIVGDTGMLAKVVREYKISEVIFATHAISYSDMLTLMQRVADENLSRFVNFNVVPEASEVLLSKRKIEILSDAEGEPIALLPMQYNIQRISHKVAKRLFDLTASFVVLPVLHIAQLVRPTSYRGELMEQCKQVLRGELSWVGAAAKGSASSLSKHGVTSLAAITLGSQEQVQDIEQIDLYYARNHTIGMDIEILLRSMMQRRKPL